MYLADALRDLPISDESARGVDVMLRDVMRGREALAPFAYQDQLLAKIETKPS